MLSTQVLWWLALPVLLLPIWWHRQKRQRLKAEPLATARFLPAAAPEQLRVWRWRELVLLLLRCLLLLALIAWLAATVLPWRGDTVLLARGVDQVWAGQRIAAAGFGTARREEIAAEALPHLLSWLRQHEYQWRADARVLVLAGVGQVAMPARLPRFGHAVRLELKPTSAIVSPDVAARADAVASPAASTSGAPAVAVVEHRVALATTAAHAPAWQALFAAFNAGADGHYVLTEEPDAATELIVWDRPQLPPQGWHAPLWWFGAGPTPPELAGAPALEINGITLRYADSARGRLWASDAWPARDAETARAIFATLHALDRAAPEYPAPAQAFAAERGLGVPVEANPAAWLGWLLLALFSLERIFTHARRR
ncbi:hypothetical protein ACFOLJ_07585 [Rugamonas sp. CCM 8940]|uniref:hypothetical protein n=1 Tax=Rugamonas sp. CCM 8940 TaxID=2765359 RepID=UPI0018F56587|nr:hypothetical protein [Rugamonas sp. CCM 8940]MBJ7310186.1 hypothetical protein [Rugamonas sp. CCM 8940]